LHSKELWYA